MFVQQKKVEIIIEVVKIPKIVRIIDTLGLSGYSIIHGVEGRGMHGMRDAQEVTDVLSNDYVLIVCSDMQAVRLLEEVAPILKKYGGICCVSDVQKLVLEEKLN